MGHVIDLPFSDAVWEPVSAAAMIDHLDAKAARDNATADQLQAELAELRRQREPAELTPPARTPAITHWIKTGEELSGTSVIDLSEPDAEEEGPPVAIELATGNSELAEARKLADRWGKEHGQ